MAKTNKREYIHNSRIVCQQVSNVQKKHRIIFAPVSQGYVLGDTCNFIAVKENPYNIDLFVLLGLFNTRLIDWFFQLTSSTNHVTNTEIDNFPIPVQSELLPNIGNAVREYLDTKNDALLPMIETMVLYAYGLEEFVGDAMLNTVP